MTPLGSATNPSTMSIDKPALDKPLTKEESFFVVDQGDISGAYEKELPVGYYPSHTKIHVQAEDTG